MMQPCPGTSCKKSRYAHLDQAMVKGTAGLQELKAGIGAALGNLMHLPLPPGAVTAAVTIMQQSVNADSWVVRGGALLFCQVQSHVVHAI